VLVVDDGAVEVGDEFELLLLHPTAPTESTKATAAIPALRLTMVPSFHWAQRIGRAEGPSCGFRPTTGNRVSSRPTGSARCGSRLPSTTDFTK